MSSTKFVVRKAALLNDGDYWYLTDKVAWQYRQMHAAKLFDSILDAGKFIEQYLNNKFTYEIEEVNYCQSTTAGAT